MEHKEKMEWLAKNDPMTYYEITSDPTNASGGGCLGIIIGFCLFIAGILNY